VFNKILFIIRQGLFSGHPVKLAVAAAAFAVDVISLRRANHHLSGVILTAEQNNCNL